MALRHHNFQVPAGVTLPQVKRALAKWNTEDIIFEPRVGFDSKLIMISDDEDVNEIRLILVELKPE